MKNLNSGGNKSGKRIKPASREKALIELFKLMTVSDLNKAKQKPNEQQNR